MDSLSFIRDQQQTEKKLLITQEREGRKNSFLIPKTKIFQDEDVKKLSNSKTIHRTIVLMIHFGNEVSSGQCFTGMSKEECFTGPSKIIYLRLEN